VKIHVKYGFFGVIVRLENAKVLSWNLLHCF